MAAQVPTQTEISVSKQTEQSRPGYFFYAKPFEVTMTVNLWGEIPQQGVYVVPINTDIVQLLSYAGGPRDRSNLEEVLVYRASGKKDQKLRILKTINVRDILEGRSDPVPLRSRRYDRREANSRVIDNRGVANGHQYRVRRSPCSV